jgi:hypothetical protein
VHDDPGGLESGALYKEGAFDPNQSYDTPAATNTAFNLCGLFTIAFQFDEHRGKIFEAVDWIVLRSDDLSKEWSTDDYVFQWVDHGSARRMELGIQMRY